MRNADVPEDGTPRRRGIFSKRSNASATTGDDAEEKISPRAETPVIDSKADYAKIIASANTANTAIAYSSGGTVPYITYTSGSLPGGSGYYSSGGITYTGTGPIISGGPITSGSSIYGSATEALKKAHEKEVADLKSQLVLAKRQLALQIDENDELIEKQSMYQRNLEAIRLTPHSSRTAAVLERVQHRFKEITDRWASKNTIEDDDLD